MTGLLYIFAFASLGAFVSGLLVVFRKTAWLGKAAPEEAISGREERVVGSVFLFVGLLGLLTSYAALVKNGPMYFLGLVFEVVRWIRGE